MGDFDIEPPTAKENLFHPGLFDAVSSGGTPRKRNRFRRPATGSSRSPLGDSSASGEATDAAAADAIDASAHELDAMPSSHPVKGVTITAEQMADLTKEERELLAKLSARLPALRPSATEPTTPPAAAKEREELAAARAELAEFNRLRARAKVDPEPGLRGSLPTVPVLC
jgi:hypothetical protein